jgi:formyltetrahydrofolate deformylase
VTKQANGVLRLTCPDRRGLVADIASLLFRLGANIIHADQHLDVDQGVFFQRVEFALGEDHARQTARESLGQACAAWGMQWTLRFQDEWPRLAILVSKRGHCALDLLARHRAGDLSAVIPLVIANHPDLAEEVERRGYPFVCESIEGDKARQESRIVERLREERIDVVVLARYMQILSPAMVDAWPSNIINIHHSFLPAFAGADPYRRAHGRGVKLIGATSHYVTRELDDGPIIAQDVVRAGHRDTVDDLERKGRDLERSVLASAVRWHLQDRIIVYGNKTVVFE